MKWAMSDDYAALITTIILAVLFVGTVQTYTLMKRWTDSYVQTAQGIVEARRRVIEAIRRSETPAAEDLEQMTSPAIKPQRVLVRAWPIMLATSIWLSICVVLVGVQVKVLLWAATHHPKADPGLAKVAFAVTAAAVVLLVIEGFIRVAAQGMSRLRNLISSAERLSAQERDALNTAIARHARNAPPAL